MRIEFIRSQRVEWTSWCSPEENGTRDVPLNEPLIFRSENNLKYYKYVLKNKNWRYKKSKIIFVSHFISLNFFFFFPFLSLFRFRFTCIFSSFFAHDAVSHPYVILPTHPHWIVFLPRRNLWSGKSADETPRGDKNSSKQRKSRE